MSDDIRTWVVKLTDGDEQAAQVIWNNYFDRLIRLADKKLKGLTRRAADEEDVALSAMNSFIRGAQAGRFPQLADRDDLWKVLVTITARKVHAHRRRHFAKKRGGGEVRGESALLKVAGEDSRVGIEQILGEEPTPALAAEFAEQVAHMLELLDDVSLPEVAQMKLEGYTNAEISKQLGWHERTIARKLQVIRRIWQASLRESEQ